MSSYRFIERQRGHYPVRELCQVLGVVPSATYAWRQRCQRPAPAWERAVGRAFARHAHRYGPWPAAGSAASWQVSGRPLPYPARAAPAWSAGATAPLIRTPHDRFGPRPARGSELGKQAAFEPEPVTQSHLVQVAIGPALGGQDAAG